MICHPAASPAIASGIGAPAHIGIGNAGTPGATPAPDRIGIGPHVAIGDAASPHPATAARRVGVGTDIGIGQTTADATGKRCGSAKGTQQKGAAAQTAAGLDVIVGQCPAFLFGLICHLKSFHNKIRISNLR